MKFCTFPAAPNPARVGFSFTEKGLGIERVIVDFLENQQNSTRSAERFIEMNTLRHL